MSTVCDTVLKTTIDVALTITSYQQIMENSTALFPALPSTNVDSSSFVKVATVVPKATLYDAKFLGRLPVCDAFGGGEAPEAILGYTLKTYPSRYLARLMPLARAKPA